MGRHVGSDRRVQVSRQPRERPPTQKREFGNVAPCRSCERQKIRKDWITLSDRDTRFVAASTARLRVMRDGRNIIPRWTPKTGH